MPPKKKGKKKKSEPPPEPEQPLHFSDEDEQEEELDYLTGLNDEFFTAASKTIQNLMEANRIYEASKIKKYVDIIHNLHRRYVAEVHENEDLRPQIERANIKLAFALELTASSEDAVQKLKEALGDSWRENDASLLREQDIQEKLQEMLIRCEQFEAKEAEKQDDTAEFGHLAKYKNIILRERDRLQGEVMDLEKRLTFQRYYAESLEYINKNIEETMQKMATRVKVLDAEKQTLTVKVRNLMNNLEDQKEVNNKTLRQLELSNRELHDTQNKLRNKQSDYERTRQFLDKCRNDNLISHQTIAKNEEDLSNLRKENKQFDELTKALRLEDKVKTNQLHQLNQKYRKAMQDQSAISSRMYKLNRLNHNMMQDIARYKNTVNALEKDVRNASLKYDELRRLKENTQRERDGLRSDILKLNNTIADLRHTIVLQNNNVDVLHMDINKLNVKIDEAKITTSKAEKERDEMAQEVETLHEKIEYLQEQLGLKTEQVTDLSEKLSSKHFQLISVKKQLESAHSEKMILQRSLETCTQERDNFRALQTKTNHQISQLTSEIIANQNKMNSLNLKIERLGTEKKELQTDLRNKEQILASVRMDLKDMKAKNESLMKTISEDEYKFMRISQELEETRKEKNLIGLQMVRRNDEICDLKERLAIQRTALDQGQTQYNQRVEDIRLLKTEISNIVTERECLTRTLKSTADMREEVIRLQRALNQERIKVRSLTEDAKTPTGVHRWRILRGEDPQRFKLLQKVQILQRRTLKQDVEMQNTLVELKALQKDRDNLRHILENLPTSDVKEKLVKATRINRVQSRKLKAMAAEIEVDKIELKVRECVIQDYRRTVGACKKFTCDGNLLDRAEKAALVGALETIETPEHVEKYMEMVIESSKEDILDEKGSETEKTFVKIC